MPEAILECKARHNHQVRNQEQDLSTIRCVPKKTGEEYREGKEKEAEGKEEEQSGGKREEVGIFQKTE